MKVNFVQRTIELSAKEMRKASNPHSCEYKELLCVSRELPDFVICVKQVRNTQNRNRGLTLKYMDEFIMQNAPEKIEEFKNIIQLGGYPAATKWFRTVFPEDSNNENLCTALNKTA